MNTQFYLHLSKKTIPGGQRWFINKLRTLIQSKNHREEFNEGLCFGISLMWIQALIANDLATFNRRLSIIAKFENAEEMRGAIERVKRKKLKGEILSKDDDIIFNLPIYLDGLLFHACLGEYVHLFPKGKRVSGQQGELSFGFTAPVNIKGGIELVRAPKTASNVSFVGTYLEADLIQYFDSLTKIIQHPPVAYSFGIELGTCDHSIAVGYNHELKKWMFVDANDLPPKPVNSSQELVKLILESETFKPYKKLVSFASSFYVAGSRKRDLETRMQQWVESEEWKKIHAPTLRKLKHYNKEENASWILTAINFRDGKLALQLLMAAKQNGLLDQLIEQNILHEAAKKGLGRVVKYLLDEGAPRNAKNKNDFTPLQLAAMFGQAETAQLLLTYGNDVDVEELVSAETEGGDTALHLAAEAGALDCVQLLLQHGAAHDAPNKRDETPFHAAASGGNVDVLTLLYEKEPLLLNQADSVDATPIFAAVENGHLEAVKYLRSVGAKVTLKNISDETPLHLAAENGHLEILEFLVKSIKKRKREKVINAGNDEGNTLLHLAAKKGRSDVVRYLLKSSAKTDIKNENGETALELAVKHDKLNVVKRLFLDEKANKDRLTHIAAKHNSVRILKFLKLQGVKTDVPNDRDETPLQAAAKNGHLETVDYLIKNGDAADIKNQRQETLLHLAAKKGRLKVVQYLAQGGADLSAKDSDGNTALDLAEKYEHKRTAQYLAEYKKQPLVPIMLGLEGLEGLEPLEEELAPTAAPEPKSEPSILEVTQPKPIIISPPKIRLSDETKNQLQTLACELSKALTYQRNGTFGGIYKFFSNLNETRHAKLHALSALSAFIADDNEEKMKTFVKAMLKEDGQCIYRDGTKTIVLRAGEVMYTSWPMHSRTAAVIHQVAKELRIKPDQSLRTSFKA